MTASSLPSLVCLLPLYVLNGAAYALAFPGTFLALIDTYHTLHSGLVNFAVLALALHDFGYRVVGIRLDSGDLAYLSVAARVFLSEIANIFALPWLKHVKICASSDLNEDVIYALNAQHHEIDVFGVGTNLVRPLTHSFDRL